MATVNFYLDKPKADKPTAIYLRFYDGNRMKFRTGEYCHPSEWISKKTVQRKKGFCQDPVLSESLKNLEAAVLKIHREYKINNEAEPSSSYMREQIQALLSKQEETKEDNSFFGLLDHFIRESKTSRRKATIQTYETLKTHLNGFAAKKRYKIEFATINASFKNKFQSYLIAEKRLTDSSIQKTFAILKRFLNFAAELGHNQHTDYLKFKIKRSKTNHVALNEEELQAVKELDLRGDSRLIRVRDLFLFGCETSLRYSDLQNLKHTNIMEEEIDGIKVPFLELVAVKTRGEIVAPLTPEALEILEKYAGTDARYCFPRISNQKFNSYIKEVCELAGIIEEVQVVKHIGKDRIESFVPKCDLITSHTQRRTFVTLFLERGGTVEECMIYTGHQSYKELQTYQKKTRRHRLKMGMRSMPTRMKKVS